jgi:hypothetical protein
LVFPHDAFHDARHAPATPAKPRLCADAKNVGGCANAPTLATVVSVPHTETKVRVISVSRRPVVRKDIVAGVETIADAGAGGSDHTGGRWKKLPARDFVRRHLLTRSCCFYFTPFRVPSPPHHMADPDGASGDGDGVFHDTTAMPNELSNYSDVPPPGGTDHGTEVVGKRSSLENGSQSQLSDSVSDGARCRRRRVAPYWHTTGDTRLETARAADGFSGWDDLPNGFMTAVFEVLHEQTNAHRLVRRLRWSARSVGCSNKTKKRKNS